MTVLEGGNPVFVEVGQPSTKAVVHYTKYREEEIWERLEGGSWGPEPVNVWAHRLIATTGYD